MHGASVWSMRTSDRTAAAPLESPTLLAPWRWLSGLTAPRRFVEHAQQLMLGRAADVGGFGHQRGVLSDGVLLPQAEVCGLSIVEALAHGITECAATRSPWPRSGATGAACWSRHATGAKSQTHDTHSRLTTCTPN